MVTDEEFIKLLKSCPLSIRDLADNLSVSRPAVERWLMGKNLPHQLIRQTIVNLLKRLEK